MSRDWLRTVLVAALVVASLGAVALAPAGGVATPDRELGPPATQTDDFGALAPRGRWNPANGTGEIILDAGSYYAVFQGEADVDAWRDTNGTDVSGAVLEGEGGQSEDDVFELSGDIPPGQTTGRYSGEGLSVRVQEPRISRVELYNSIGTELEDASELQREEPMLVVVDWNYVAAEDLQVDLVDRESDITVEREALSAAPTAAQADLLPAGFDRANLAREIQGVGTTGYRTAYWLLDFEAVDAGSYTLRVEGVDDLTTGDAAETVRVDVGATTPGPSPTPTATPGPTPTPRVTPTATPETTATPTPTATAAPTPTATATPTPTATAAPTPTATATPTATPGAEGPGFGPAATLAALLLSAGYVLGRQ
jgi:cell division septation protein DedD